MKLIEQDIDLCQITSGSYTVTFWEPVQKILQTNGWQAEVKFPKKRELQPLLKERVIEEPPVEEVHMEAPVEVRLSADDQAKLEAPVKKKKPWWKSW
ncbi:MAG: hypothetical protein HRT88_23925 [Lentisphaeraceae bacterium]|nr:hypothetical protein [Lentisphaeraceae bacterium]